MTPYDSNSESDSIRRSVSSGNGTFNCTHPTQPMSQRETVIPCPTSFGAGAYGADRWRAILILIANIGPRDKNV